MGERECSIGTTVIHAETDLTPKAKPQFFAKSTNDLLAHRSRTWISWLSEIAVSRELYCGVLRRTLLH
jgi:hypothetical protein